MQDDTQTPGYDPQEPNNTPDPWGADPWGDAANLEGFEEFGQEQPSGEEAADVVGKKLPPWMVRTAAGAGAEEADQFAPEGLAAESEDPAASADLSDPALYDTGVTDPWGTPPPGTVEQEGEPIFTPPWGDPNASPPGGVEQEEGSVFNPLFGASWEDTSTTPDVDAGTFAVGWDSVPDTTPEGQEEEPAFAAPWEDASTTPDLDASTFAVGWDSVPDATPEVQEDDSTAVGEEMLNPLDVWSDQSGVTEELTAAGDIWQDTTEDLVEDMSGAFEDVGEATEDIFDDKDVYDDIL
jgi:hypothetical protein